MTKCSGNSSKNSTRMTCMSRGSETGRRKMMAEDLISRQAAIDALDAYIKLNKAPTHYENQFWIDGMEDAERIIKELPSAQPEHLHTVMKKIGKRYEKAMNTPCINNPMAWALYETWKEYDR